MFKILFIIALALEAVCVPLFLHYYWPDRTKKSFTMKAISSLLFIACGFFAIKWSGNNTEYATYILLGLIFGATGDIALHALNRTKIWSPVGVVLFLIGHIFYISAFNYAIDKERAGGSEFAERISLIFFCVAMVGLIIYAALVFAKQRTKKAAVLIAGLFVYGIILMLMVAKAVEFAMTRFDEGWFDFTSFAEMFEDSASIVMVIGAVLFAISDLILGSLIAKTFRGEKTKRYERIINILTYYPAQLILASSVLIIPFNLV